MYDFQGHLQCSERRWCFSQTGLQWFDLLPGLLSACSSMSPVIPGAARLLVSAPRLVAGTPRCSPGCHWTSYVHPDFSHMLPDAPEGHCISPVNSRIWPPWDSSPTTPRHSQTLPVTKIHIPDVHGYSNHRMIHCFLPESAESGSTATTEARSTLSSLHPAMSDWKLLASS